MRRIWMVVAIIGMSIFASAQQPKVVNAQLHTESVGAGLPAAVEQLKHSSGPMWLGYAVAAVPGSHFSMCSSEESMKEDGCCGVYRLEAENHNYRSSAGDHGTDPNIAVLARLETGEVKKVRFIGSSCQLDAGGLPFTWLTNVKADDSVMWLSSLVNKDDRHHADQALAAIAMHETQKATAAGEGCVLARSGTGARGVSRAQEDGG